MVKRLSPLHMPRIATEHDANGVFHLCDLVFNLGNGGRGGFVLGTGLFNGHLGDLAILEPQFEKLHGLGVGLKGFPGNPELVIKTQELDVVAGNRRNQAQNHPAPRLLDGQKLGPGGFEASLYDPTDRFPSSHRQRPGGKCRDSAKVRRIGEILFSLMRSLADLPLYPSRGKSGARA